jgi:hypothetical protein
MAGRPALLSLVVLSLLGSPVSAWLLGAPMSFSTTHRACSRRGGVLACAMQADGVKKKLVLGSGLFAPDIGTGDDASPPPDPAAPFVPLPKSDIQAVFNTVPSRPYTRYNVAPRAHGGLGMESHAQEWVNGVIHNRL